MSTQPRIDGWSLMDRDFTVSQTFCRELFFGVTSKSHFACHLKTHDSLFRPLEKYCLPSVALDKDRFCHEFFFVSGKIEVCHEYLQKQLAKFKFNAFLSICKNSWQSSNSNSFLAVN
jgi:hypothetical protein